MRIAVLHFSHETVTFLANDTTLADFTYPGSPAKGDAVLAMISTDTPQAEDLTQIVSCILICHMRPRWHVCEISSS